MYRCVWSFVLRLRQQSYPNKLFQIASCYKCLSHIQSGVNTVWTGCISEKISVFALRTKSPPVETWHHSGCSLSSWCQDNATKQTSVVCFPKLESLTINCFMSVNLYAQQVESFFINIRHRFASLLSLVQVENLMQLWREQKRRHISCTRVVMQPHHQMFYAHIKRMS